MKKQFQQSQLTICRLPINENIISTSWSGEDGDNIIDGDDMFGGANNDDANNDDAV